MVSGLPAGGKTSLARQLAPALALPVIDKDDILEDLFAAKGSGDAEWRRRLSRESDEILQAKARDSDGAILVSFWRRPGMAGDSGTATDWLAGLSNHLVNVHCICPPAIAAERFLQRRRHPGHLDARRSHAEVLASLRQVAELPLIPLGQRVEVDTSTEVNVDEVARNVVRAFQRCARLSHDR